MTQGTHSIDGETLEVRAVSSSNIGDAPMLSEVLNQIPLDRDIGNVLADGAYDSRKCQETIAARAAHAVIPPRKNAKPWKPTSAGAICEPACKIDPRIGVIGVQK